MKKCVIIAAMPVSESLRSYCVDADFVIAADGGWQQAEKLGVYPDLLLGDYDSAPPPETQQAVVHLPCEKDDTDTYYAARKALELGAQQVVLLGGLGGRLDHTFANLQTLLFLHSHGIKVCMADETTEISVLGQGRHVVPKPSYDCYLSVFSAERTVQGISLEGLKYPLANAMLCNTYPIGTSNEFAGDYATIRIENGTVFLFVVKK